MDFEEIEKTREINKSNFKEALVVLVGGIIVLAAIFFWYYQDVQKRSQVSEILRGNKSTPGAVELHDKGDLKSLKEAMALYSKALDIKDDYPVLNAKASMLAFQMDFFYGVSDHRQLGIKLLDELEKNNVDKEERFAAKCFKHLGDGDLVQAIESVDKITKRVGKKASFSSCQGEAQLLSGKFDDALSNFLAAKQLSYKNPLLPLGAAKAYLNKWDIRNTKAMAKTAIKTNGRIKSAKAYLAIANAIGERKGFRKSKSEIDETLADVDSLGQKDAELAKAAAATIYWRLGEAEKASNYLKETGNFLDSTVGEWVSSQIEYLSGDKEKAIKQMKAVVDSRKDLDNLKFEYLKLLAKTVKPKETLKELDTFIKENTKDLKPSEYPVSVFVDRLTVLAEIPNYFRDRKIRKMFESDVIAGLKADETNSKIAYFNMIYFINRGKVEPAFKSFQVAKNGSDSYNTFFNLGTFLLNKRGFFNDGLAMLNEAVKIRSRSAY